MQLRIEGLTVVYDRETAVKEIDLEIGDGETVGLVGPNGAGKSSIINSIIGLVRPRAGTIRFGEQSLIGQAPDEIARQGVALVPEGRRVFADLTVKQNLALGLTVHRGDTSADEDMDQMLERFPVLSRLAKTQAGKLSGGEQQQLAIARALVSRPNLVLMDEPSLGLAPSFVDVIFEILTQLRESGVTMLLVEQNVKRTIAFAERTYIMRAGRIELSGRREELQQQDELVDAYLGGVV